MSGPPWLGNALIFEHNRQTAEEQASACEQAGETDRAAWWRERAANWERSRDREQRFEEDRALNRRLFRRRY